MARNPVFNEILDKMKRVHDKKNEDYADSSNPYSNFENTAKLTGLTVGQVFHVMISIKVERLRQLASGKTPNFESMEDTILDMANYCALWLSWIKLEEGRHVDTYDRGEPRFEVSFDPAPTPGEMAAEAAARYLRDGPNSTLTGMPHDPPKGTPV